MKAIIALMNRKPYPSDLTDQEWQLSEPRLPKEKPAGRHRTVELREIRGGYLLRAALWLPMEDAAP